MKMRKRLGYFALAAVSMLILIFSTACEQNDMITCGGCGPRIEFPINDEVTLTWWYDYDNTYYNGDFTRLEDHPFMKEMYQRTNVTVSIMEPTSADPKTELEMLMASGDMPDMVTHSGYTPEHCGRNIDALAQNEVYQALNDYIFRQMRNFMLLKDEHPVVDALIVTQQNNIMFIPKLKHLTDYENKKQTEGLVLRKDILDLVNCDVPTTVAEWETVLRAFKALSVTNPLALDFNEQGAFEQDVFLSAYGVKVGAYIDSETGNVTCGAVSDKLYEYITLMNRWISDGLLVTDVKLTEEAKLEEKTVGAWFSSADEMTVLTASALTEDYELVGAPDPVLNKGEKISMRGSFAPVGTAEYDSVFISALCENGPLACRWLDEFFTEEMYERTSYGIEGIDYLENADGVITFTEKITQNRNGVCYGIAQNAFLESFYCDSNVMIDYGYNGNAKIAVEEWSESSSEYSFFDLGGITYTEEEMKYLSKTANSEVRAARTVKNMILGTEPLENWQTYCEIVREDAETYTAVMQSVWDRYITI